MRLISFLFCHHAGDQGSKYYVSMKKYGIVDPVVARKLYGEAMKETKLADYTFPTKPSSDGYFHTWITDETKKTGRRQVKAKTLVELKEKILELNKVTFEDVFYQMLSTKKEYVKGDKIYSAMNTVSVYEKFYKRCFKDSELIKRSFDELTDVDICEFVGSVLMRFDLRQAAYGTLKCILNQTFAYGFRHGLIFENPCLKVEFFSRKYTSMIVEDVDIESRMYMDSELGKLLDYIHSGQGDPKLAVGFYALEFQMLTGMRQGEVCPLTWDDVKESEDGTRFILVHKEVIRVYDKSHEGMYELVGHTKTYKNRKVPVWDELGAFLERLKRQGFSDTWLFPGKGPEGSLKPDCLYSRHKRACKETGVVIEESRRRGTHAFRRNFAKRIDDPKLATKILGNTEKVLSRHYYDGYDLSRAIDVVNRNGSLVTK